MSTSRRYDASFFTATILDWKFLLVNDLYKDIIVDSLRYLVSKNKILVHAFVIMDNHIHLIWHIVLPNKPEHIQRDFLKFLANTFIKDLRISNPVFLLEFFKGTKDREFQIWERDALSVDLWSEDVLKQKLDYIHTNPVRAGMCEHLEDYKYSTAGGYYRDFVEPFTFR